RYYRMIFSGNRRSSISGKRWPVCAAVVMAAACAAAQESRSKDDFVWRYDVKLDAEARTLEVTAAFSNSPPAFSFDAAPGLAGDNSGLVTGTLRAGEKTYELVVSGASVTAKGAPVESVPCTLTYRLDLGKMAREFRLLVEDREHRWAATLNPNLWLIHPPDASS